MNILLKHGMVHTKDGFQKKDLSILHGRIAEIADHIDEKPAIFEKVIPCDNFFILPGLIDVHVHFREPGFEYKETIATGSRAAAHGGYTTVCTMPNLHPAPTDRASLQRQLDIIRKDARVHVIPYGAITADQSGRGILSAMDEMTEDVVAFSDDGKGVQPDALMAQAMQTAKHLHHMIVAHCEDERYPTEDPRSEWKQVERDLHLAKETGCSYHVCHISTKESVALIRAAKQDGVNVSCETASHYLIFERRSIPDEGRFKMNPPIRTEEDRTALRNGLIDGTIDMIATDHAPHSAEEKAGTFRDSLFGIVGLETAFPVLYTELVQTGMLTLEQLTARMSTIPAQRFGLAGGSLEPGCPADLMVYDPQPVCRIDPDTFFSKGHSTPFAGWRVSGEVVMTLVNGRMSYER